MSMAGNYEGSREWLIEQNEALKARVAELGDEIADYKERLDRAYKRGDRWKDACKEWRRRYHEIVVLPIRGEGDE